MIVFGSTKADAHVTLSGEPVKLRPDGSFTVRLSMPDKRQVIPIVAASRDGLEQRTVVIAIERNTKETQIVLTLNLDGTGAAKVDTGIPFFNHMLEAWSKHALMDLAVDAKGDLDVDLHHTVEDVGICLGKALREAVGDRKGIVRYGASFLPMDEALLHAAVDISGRPYLVFNVPLQRTRIANFDLDLLKDFFRAVAVNAEITLHLNMHYGENLHHIAEATFKAAGRALAEATRLNPRITGILSTKGSL
jgi:imidazoleglycerol-phosphate dehydratase